MMMNKKIDWTEIVNLAGQMHNHLQDQFMPMDKQFEQDTIYKIFELLGCDISKIYEMCDEIDGCCFEIAQGDNREINHLVDESNAIDKCSSDLRYMFDEITGNY